MGSIACTLASRLEEGSLAPFLEAAASCLSYLVKSKLLLAYVISLMPLGTG